MRLSKLFPTYSIQITFRERDKAGRKIRIRPAQIYVDVPQQIYSFIVSICSEMFERNISADEFKRRWKDFVAREKSICLDGKPLVRLHLIDNSISNTRTISLRINWDVFFEYLERKSEHWIAQIEKDGKMIKDAYNEILANFYFSTGGHLRLLKIKEDKLKQTYGRNFENFRKILLYAGDYYEIKFYLERLLELIARLEDTFYEENEASVYFTSQLKMWWYGLLSAFEILSIPACYFHLRNILELLIKLIIYQKIAESFKENREIVLMLLFEGERIKAGGKSIYKHDDLKNWEIEINKALNRILSKPLEELQEDWENKVLILKDKCLNLTRKSIEIICKEYNLQANLKNLWTACSEIIHNQPPLPFYSLLEIKIFKHFLKYYIEELKRALSHYVELTDISTDYRKVEREIDAKRLKIIYDKLFEFKEEIKKFILEVIGKEEYKRQIWFDPLTLASIFNIWSPRPTRMYWHCLTEEDLDRLIEKVEPLSFQIGLDFRKEETLQIFYQELIPKLEKFVKDLSKISEEEKRIITLWILATTLPEVLEEMLEDSIKRGRKEMKKC